MGLNQCTFLGRLTRDPEIRYSSGAVQMPIARFTLAVDRWKKDGESEADFFPCVAFDKKAEFAEKHLYCGIRVLVSGSMKNNNYTNKAGEKVYGMELQANHIEFADGKREEDELAGEKPAASGQDGQAPEKAGENSAQSRASAARNNDGRSASDRAPAQDQQRTAPSRSAAGRSAGRTSTGRRGSVGGRFSNVAEGAEDAGNPFN